MKSRKTFSKPLIQVSSPQGHFVSPMAESHLSKEEAKDKCKKLLKAIPVKLQVQGEQKENEMVFVGPDEGELLELSEVHEEFLKEDELN